MLIAITAPRPSAGARARRYPTRWYEAPARPRPGAGSDRLRSYAAAKAELGLSEPRTGIAQEQSHRVFSHLDKAAREKDAALQVAWISPTVLSIHAALRDAFDIERHLRSRRTMVSFAAMHLDMASGNCNVKRVVR